MVVALAGPRREQEQDPRAVVGRDRPALVGVKPRENSGACIDRLAARLEPHLTVKDDDPRTLVHLMVAERLSGIQADQHRARLVVRLHDDRRAASARRVELAQVPRLQCGRSMTLTGGHGH